jgi:hypothetical protein
VYPKSGFKTVTGIQFLNGLALLEQKRISFRAFRVYIAAFAIIAVREAAERSKKKQSGRGETPSPRYEARELASLCGATVREVQHDLKRLRAEGILSFSEKEIKILETPIPESLPILSLVRSPARPIPVPRSALRFLAREKRQVVSKTMIAYMLRGLSLSRKDAQVSGRGSVKLSWIAAVSGLSERGARDGRRGLISLGWIGRDTGSTQWKLNRDGAYFSINLEWEWKVEKKSVGNVDPQVFAAPLSPKSPDFAAPNKDRKTPNGSKDQKSSSGVLGNGIGERPSHADLRNVRPEDLFHLSRCEELYWQAVDKKLIPASESSALNFLSAAVRARSIKTGDPSRVFVAIIKKGLWNHITFEQEEKARLGLSRIWREDSRRFRVRGEGQQLEIRDAA